jgi:hypothetical protein
MITPREVLNTLLSDELFLNWKTENPESFLSHFFAPLNKEFETKSNWEIGFFNNDKITVFVPVNGKFGIKPADEIFKKPEAKVEQLNIEEVKLTFEDSLELFKKNLPEEFPNTDLGDGFVILQTYREKTLWNFTFITKKLKFINLKFNASSGELEDSQEVDLVQKS